MFFEEEGKYACQNASTFVLEDLWILGIDCVQLNLF